GRPIAFALGERGAAVGFCFREREDAAREVEALLGKSGARSFAAKCDVAVEAEAQGFIAAAEKALGPIDLLVHNAGLTLDGPFLFMDNAQWRRVMDVNLDGAFHSVRA